MKILYCSLHPDLNLAAPSGPGTHMREVIRSFEKQGHTVVPIIAGGTVLSDAAAPIQLRRNTIRKFIPKWLWLTLKDLYLYRRNLLMKKVIRETVLREKPDMIYERISYMSTAVSEVAAELGITHFSEFNAPYSQERVKLEGWSITLFLAKRAEKKQLFYTTKAFTVSSILKDYLVEKTGVDASKIVVTPNAVNPEKFAPNEKLQKEIRRKWGIEENAKVVGFVGSIFPYHGVDLLIDAFLIEREKSNEHLKLLVVGDGETLPSLRERVKHSKYANAIVFTGNVPYAQVADYLAIMDVAVMARSDWYMSPVKIFEYGLMQKSIVAQNTSPINDVMEHKVHGWIAESTVEGLHQGIAYMLEHEEEAKAMAQAFYSKVLSMHTWDEVGKQILREKL